MDVIPHASSHRRLVLAELVTGGRSHVPGGHHVRDHMLLDVSLESIHIRDVSIFKQYIKKHFTYRNFEFMVLNIDDDHKRDRATL
jgi:hypothetical protein